MLKSQKSTWKRNLIFIYWSEERLSLKHWVITSAQETFLVISVCKYGNHAPFRIILMIKDCRASWKPLIGFLWFMQRKKKKNQWFWRMKTSIVNARVDQVYFHSDIVFWNKFSDRTWTGTDSLFTEWFHEGQTQVFQKLKHVWIDIHVDYWSKRQKLIKFIFKN